MGEGWHNNHHHSAAGVIWDPRGVPDHVRDDGADAVPATATAARDARPYGTDRSLRAPGETPGVA